MGLAARVIPRLSSPKLRVAFLTRVFEFLNPWVKGPK